LWFQYRQPIEKYHLHWFAGTIRIFMNLILIKSGFFPAVIRTEKKRNYLETLSTADKGDLVPFIQFIATELITTYEEVISNLSLK
jgi:Fic family protein